MAQMSIEDKRMKLATYLGVIAAIGFPEFKMFERQNIPSSFEIDESHFDRAPAFYLHSCGAAFIDLALVYEDESSTNNIGHMVAHEWSHWITFQSLERDEDENENKVIENLGGNGTPEALLRKSINLHPKAMHDAFPDLWECFTNQMAYYLLAHAEEMKVQVVYSKRIEEIIAQGREYNRIHNIEEDEDKVLAGFAKSISGIFDSVLDSVFQVVRSNSPLYPENRPNVEQAN